MTIDRRTFIGLVSAGALLPVWVRAERPRTVGLLFDSLVSPFWVAAVERLKGRMAARGWSTLEAVSNLDDNRQYEQLQSMIQRGVDGIVMVHTDNKAVIPAIRAANAANVPLVHFNRAPAPNDAYSIAVVADNRRLMADTVESLVGIARRAGGRYRAAFLLGDLADSNAVDRRNGFEDAVDRHRDVVEVVARIATDWNADKAFAGLSNALQAHPDINMLVTSSDFLTPQIEQALRVADKWQPAGSPGHVLIAGFDGDQHGYAEIQDGFYEVDGVQDLDYEVDLTLTALTRLWQGEHPPKTLVDPGFVISRSTLLEQRTRMWGYDVWRQNHGLAARTPRPTEIARAPAASAASTPDLGRGTFAYFSALFSILTLNDVLLTMIPLGILVAGQMIVMIAGQIDLSMGAVMAICSVGAAAAMRLTLHHSGAVPASIAGAATSLMLGALIGLFNGSCCAIAAVPSFIVTLAVMMAGAGAAVWCASLISDSMSIGDLPVPFRWLGYGGFAGIPVALLVSAATLLTVHLILSRTLAGRWLYAVGHNTEAARIAGVPTGAVTVAAFVASGLCSALASIIYTSRVEAGLPTLGQNQLLDIVGAAVIGGISLFGGRGNVAMVLGGIAFLSLLNKSLQLLGLSLFIVLALKGAAILAAAFVDARRAGRVRGP